jgi:hypothetical protein
MLIQIFEDPQINSFAQLYWKTHQMVVEHHLNPNRTVVFGPISDRDPAVVSGNLEALSLRAQQLSDAGWVVVDIASYYNITERLIREHNVSGYPFVLLEEFTLPLIRSFLFPVFNFRTPFEHSLGTKREHAEVSENKLLRISYFS